MSRQKKKTFGVYTPMLADLRDDLSSGRLTLGDRLPAEAELGDRYGISVNSVRRGIAELVRQGWVAKRRGSGSYVTRIPKPERVSPRAAVRKDTVAVCFDTQLLTYHPHFSELRRGIIERLAERGWNALKVSGFDSPRYAGALDIVYPGYEARDILGALQACQTLAGVILSAQCVQMLEKQCDTALPVVVPDLCAAHPSVGYDWDAEVSSGLGILLEKGARDILALDLPTARGGELLHKAAAARLVGETPPPRLHERKRKAPGTIISAIIHESFDQTLAELERLPKIDGILAGSDFALQGVLDALAQRQARSGTRPVAVVAIVNRTSRLHVSLPYTALIVDGYRLGVETVDLLIEHIAGGVNAHLRRLLRCDQWDQHVAPVPQVRDNTAEPARSYGQPSEGC